MGIETTILQAQLKAGIYQIQQKELRVNNLERCEKPGEKEKDNKWWLGEVNERLKSTHVSYGDRY